MGNLDNVTWDKEVMKEEVDSYQIIQRSTGQIWQGGTMYRTPGVKQQRMVDRWHKSG